MQRGRNPLVRGLACLVLVLTLATNIRWSLQLQEYPTSVVDFSWVVSNVQEPSKGGTSSTSIDDTTRSHRPPPAETIVEPQDFIFLRADNQTKIKIDKDNDNDANLLSPIVLEDYKLVFFPLPPATIWKRLFRRMLGYADWATATPHNPATNGLTFLHDFSLEQANVIMTSPHYTRAMFVRDPKEKFYSLYQDTIVPSQGRLMTRLCCPVPTQENCGSTPASLGTNSNTTITPQAVLSIIPNCRDPRWTPLTERLESKYWNTINFVGHWDNADKDAQRLLESLGVWTLFGASGWGKGGQFSLSAQLTAVYQPKRRFHQMDQFYQTHGTLERQVEDVYAIDYDNPALELAREELLDPTDFIYYKNTRLWDAAPIVVEPLRLVFFTIPKNGCTTWKMLFRRMNGASNYAVQDEREGLPHDPLHNGLTYLWHYSPREANRILTSPHYTRAVFVRDPKERFLSAYLDKALSGPKFLFEKCCNFHPHLNRTYEDMDEESSACVRTAQASPLGFLALIQNCSNAHWTPQHHRMEEKYWSTLNFIGRQEQLVTDTQRLLQQIGAWEDFGQSGWGTDGKQAIFQKGTNHNQSHTTHAKDKYEWYYTPELEEQVDQYYAVDYANPLFGYHSTTNTNTTTTTDTTATKTNQTI